MLGNTLCIINPVSRSGKVSKVSPTICAKLRQLVSQESPANICKIVETQGPKEAEQIALYEGTEFDTIVTLGGDGLIHEVVNGLMRLPKEDRPQLAILPCGNGDDFARTLNISKSPLMALEQLVSFTAKPVDIGCVNGEYFTETLSFGLDAAIAIETMQLRQTTGRTGTILYLQAGINQLYNHLDLYDCEITLDGVETISTNVYLLAIQNGPYYGGGFKVCPQATNNDGTFDICYAEPILTFPKALKVFLSAKDGKHVNHPNVRFDKAHTLSITFKQPVPAQVDGEEIKGNVFKVSIEPAALKVFY